MSPNPPNVPPTSGNGTPATNTPPPSTGRKPSAAETKDRRMEVFRLQMRGVSQAAMAKVLQVNRNTIIRDVRWLKDHVRELALDADKFGEVGNAMKFYEEIEREAMFQYHEVDAPHAKNNLLMTAITAREKKVRLMADMGIIDKAPTDVNLNMDWSKFTTEELIAKREEIIAKLRGAGLETSGSKNN